MKFLFALLLFILSMPVVAEGGKHGNPHMIIGEDGCTYVVGNIESCERVPAPPQSGIEVYICGNVTATCPEDSSEDEEDEHPGKR